MTTCCTVDNFQFTKWQVFLQSCQEDVSRTWYRQTLADTHMQIHIYYWCMVHLRMCRRLSKYQGSTVLRLYRETDRVQYMEKKLFRIICWVVGKVLLLPLQLIHPAPQKIKSISSSSWLGLFFHEVPVLNAFSLTLAFSIYWILLRNC